MVCIISKGLVINYGEGGLQNGKIAGTKLLRPPPPSRQGKTFCVPPFKEWKLVAPPFNMAKTSSYRIKTTLKTFCAPPPSAWLKNSAPPPFS